MELLTPDEFFKRVGFRVPENVIRNLEAEAVLERTRRGLVDQWGVHPDDAEATARQVLELSADMEAWLECREP